MNGYELDPTLDKLRHKLIAMQKEAHKLEAMGRGKGSRALQYRAQGMNKAISELIAWTMGVADEIESQNK